MRSVERPRLVIVTTVLVVIIAIVLLGGGVLIGRGSVEDKGPTEAQLRQATAATGAAKGELATVSGQLTERVTELKQDVKRWRTRARREERSKAQWRKRARRAERRARAAGAQ